MQTKCMWILGALMLLTWVTVISRPQEDFLKQVPGLIGCIPSPLPYKIPDSLQCDKYHICHRGEAVSKLCDDGTAFDPPTQECIALRDANCEGRPILQEANGQGECPRKTGSFPHKDPAQCDKFYLCRDGHPTVIECPERLLFNRAKGGCDYPDRADISHCQLPPSPVVCPSRNGSWTLLPNPSDCRLFFLCQKSVPRPLACEEHMAFDPKTLSCIDKSLVSHCSRAS